MLTLFDQPDFTNYHGSENSAAMEAFYQQHLDHFRDQAQNVFKYMVKGGKINPDNAKELYGIRHLAKRINEISNYIQSIGLSYDDIVRERMDNRCMEYSFTPKAIEILKLKNKAA